MGKPSEAKRAIS